MLRKFKISIDGKEYLVEMEEIGGVHNQHLLRHNQQRQLLRQKHQPLLLKKPQRQQHSQPPQQEQMQCLRQCQELC